MGATPAAVPEAETVPVLAPVAIGANGEAVSPTVAETSVDGPLTAEPEAVLVASAEAPAALPASDAAPKSGWIVQIGAAPDEAGAKGLIASAADTLGSPIEGWVERFEKNGQVFFRARLGSFGNRDAASGICSRLKAVKMSCLAMPSI